MTTASAVDNRVRIGDTLGHPMEHDVRFARVVGFRKDDCKPIERVIIRMYRDGDALYPTGEYRTTWLCVRWEPR